MPAYQQAVDVHNVFRQVVIDADQAYAPFYKQAMASADIAYPDDTAAYQAQLLPYTDMRVGLTLAKQAEQEIFVMLSQWKATADGAGVLPQTFACAADAVSKLTFAAGKLPGGSPFYAALFAVGVQLRSMAGSTSCPVKK